MIKTLIKAHPYTDQERVAILALKHNLKAIPVVDKENKFLGVVTSDTILDILHSEHVEDILRSAGVHDGVYFPSRLMKVPISILAKARIPWLIVGLLGGIFAAQIANFFETPLKTHFALVGFIPLIVYIADAVGTQTQTLVARSLAIDFEFSFKRYLLKEIKVSLLIALALGVLLSVISILWYRLPYLGLILGISLFLAVIASIFIGSLIPYLLQKFKQDPAIGSGPFATIITDIASLVIYFSIASLLLKLFF
jgi:magnesium transporter